jgi:dTDP-4-dehydrorhamnose 3,5-epimerase-like enzyme
MCLGNEPCILVNVPTHVYDPEDEYKLDPFDPSIPYQWPVKSR